MSVWVVLQYLHQHLALSILLVLSILVDGKIPWRRKWQPTPVFLPGESHGQRSPRGCKESDMTEQLTHILVYQFSSVAQSCPTLCDPMDCSTPGFPVHHQLLELAQTHVHQVGDDIQSSHPLSSPSPAFNLSQHQGLFKWVGSLHLLAVQGTLKSLLQHRSSKVSVLWHSAFFMVQLSHPYMTTEKTIALTRRTFVSKVMSQLFNMLPRFVIAFLQRSKWLLSWLHSPSVVILEPKKIKSLTVSIVSPPICHEVMDRMPWSSFLECWGLFFFFYL